MKREFDGKIWKTGNAFVITIPMRIIKKFKLTKGDSLLIVIKKEED